MKLKRLKIDHYGPLTDIDYDLDNGITVFYGKNESGKTLLTESIAKSLVSTEKGFDGIGRVSQKPSGLILFENGEDEVDLLNKDFLGLEPGLENEDIRNTFIIRDFDLRVPERGNDFGQSDYFGDITDRVMGSDTQKISELKSELVEIGHLKSESNSKITNTRSDNKLQSRKEEAETLISNIEDFRDNEDVDIVSLFSDRRQAEERLEEISNVLDKLEKAEKKEKFEDGQQLLKELNQIRQKQKDLEERESDIESLREIRNEIEDFIGSDNQKQSNGKLLAGSGILTGLSLTATALTQGILPIITGITSIILAGSTVYLGWHQLQSKNVESERKKKLQKVSNHDIDAENLQEADKKLEEEIDNFEDKKQSLNSDWSSRLGALKEKFSEQSDDIEFWEEYLENPPVDMDLEVEYDEERVEELEDEQDKLEKKVEELDDDLQTHERKLEDFNTKLNEVLDGTEIDVSPVAIDSVEDLDEALNRLNNFVDRIETDADSSNVAIEILDELEEEEEDEFNQIFSDGSYAVEMFREATNGRYTDIRYDKAEKKIVVTQDDGKELNPRKLSQGTYDLLYLAVRLNVIKELLDEPGFVVLDNSFLHSDAERIKEEVKFLNQLADEGWQIIYFSFRESVKNAFEDNTQCTINELEKL